MNMTNDWICATRESVVEAAKKVRRLDQSSQKLSEMVSLISQVASQIRLQAMKATLEAARTGTGQEFASIAEKALSLTLQLNADIAKIEPLVAEIQTKTFEVVAAIEAGTEQAIAGTQSVEETQQKLNHIATVSAQMKTLVEELAQAAAEQAQTSTKASQSVLEVASIASQTSEQSLAVAESLAKLAAVAQ
jgi:twitching motility protein PilJ